MRVGIEIFIESHTDAYPRSHIKRTTRLLIETYISFIQLPATDVHNIPRFYQHKPQPMRTEIQLFRYFANGTILANAGPFVLELNSQQCSLRNHEPIHCWLVVKKTSISPAQITVIQLVCTLALPFASIAISP